MVTLPGTGASGIPRTSAAVDPATVSSRIEPEKIMVLAIVLK
jgi:hypothetical protein